MTDSAKQGGEIKVLPAFSNVLQAVRRRDGVAILLKRLVHSICGQRTSEPCKTFCKIICVRCTTLKGLKN